jgi:hypothetical protein
VVFCGGDWNGWCFYNGEWMGVVKHVIFSAQKFEWIGEDGLNCQNGGYFERERVE